MTLTRVGFICFPPGKQPGFDHADVYRGQLSTARLYVAHTGADRIEVIDCVCNTYLHSLPDVPGVAGILIDSERDFLFRLIVVVLGQPFTITLPRRCSVGPQYLWSSKRRRNDSFES